MSFTQESNEDKLTLNNLIDFDRLIRIIKNLFMFLGVITFFYLIVGISLTPKENEIQTQKVNLPSSEPFYPEETSTSTPKPKLTLQFPKSDVWEKYNATCLGLKQDVVFYFPQSWKIGEYGETSITDGPGLNPISKASECEVSFGYPIAPLHPQSPYTPGLFGYLQIGSYITEGQTLAKLFEEPSGRNEKAKYITEIGGNKWIKLINENSNSEYLMTIYKNRTYQIYFNANVDYSQIDASSSGYLFGVYDDFIKKLEFH